MKSKISFQQSFLIRCNKILLRGNYVLKQQNQQGKIIFVYKKFDL